MTRYGCTCLPQTYWYPAEPDEGCPVHGVHDNDEDQP